jgi:Phosphoesterase family
VSRVLIFAALRGREGVPNPFHYALAENFTICDNYHCSVPGPTWPNRLYHMSAWIDPAGVAGGPIISNIDPTPCQWKSYPEALTAAGVSWQVPGGRGDGQMSTQGSRRRRRRGVIIAGTAAAGLIVVGLPVTALGLSGSTLDAAPLGIWFAAVSS